MTTSQDDFYNNLISIAAHDLKTPISAVKGFIELVQQAGPLNDQQMHFSERALQSLQRMEKLVADLLEFSRINSGNTIEMAECDLNALVKDAVEALEEAAARRKVTIQVDTMKAPRTVTGDPRLLALVVQNLIGNAVKYNREGGTVWVTAFGESGTVRVDVRDTGIGIPAEDQHRVFERFFRAKTSGGVKVEGSGLGLAIVQAIVKKHGGRIWVDSTPGEGSTFSFALPLQADAAVGARSQKSGEPRGPFPFDDNDTGSEEHEMDVIDDNLQEAPQEREIDSKSDAI